MCSGVLCARVNFRDVLCRQVFPLCLTSRRERHMKTRAIIGRVKPLAVVGKSSKPLPQYRQQFEVEDFQHEALEEDLDNPLLDVKSATDAKNYIREVRGEFDERARKLKRLLERKELNPFPPESNLLHWAARQQIRYLHKKDPLEWTPEKIAEEFPISVLGAKRLLGSALRITEDEIEKFNKEVDERWRLLRKIRSTGKIPETGPVLLHQKTIELFLDNKLQCEDLKKGNPEFPQAPPQLDIRVPFPVGREGKNFAILQEYTNLLEAKSSETQDQVSTKGFPRHAVEFNSGMPSNFEPNCEIGDDPEAATHLDLPPNLRYKLYRPSRSDSMTLKDFKAQTKIERDPVQIEGKVESKTVVRKKKLRHSEKPVSAPRKFKEPPRQMSRNQESDGTHSIGRNVFSSDGELLYRKSSY